MYPAGPTTPAGLAVASGIGFVFHPSVIERFARRRGGPDRVASLEKRQDKPDRLPEPRRSAGGPFYASAAPARGAQEASCGPAGSPAPADSGVKGLGRVGELAEQRHVRPYPDLVLHSDPAGRSLWWAVRYVLRVRTNLVIIVATALAYFYLSGVSSFAMLYVQGHYRISQSAATLVVVAVCAGTVAGGLAGGKVSDRLLRRGMGNARVVVPMAAVLASVPFLALGFSPGPLLAAVPLLVIGAFFLSSANPPSDAARLDIMHPHLWGRSEGIRSFLRTLLQAAAPIVFGFVSEHLADANGGGSKAWDTRSSSSWPCCSSPAWPSCLPCAPTPATSPPPMPPSMRLLPPPRRSTSSFRPCRPSAPRRSTTSLRST